MEKYSEIEDMNIEDLKQKITAIKTKKINIDIKLIEEFIKNGKHECKKMVYFSNKPN